MKHSKYIIGIDEAGRGPFAGPLFASAVILKETHQINGLADSKKLSCNSRELLYEQITAHAYFYVASVSSKYIDKHGLRAACKEVFKRAYKGLMKKHPTLIIDKLLIDGRDNFKFDIEAEYIIKGDDKVPCISAASILAKVSRDRYMVKMANKYPNFAFEKHKGYGTRLHRDLMDLYGVCDIHRKSFKPVKDVIQLKGN